MNRTDCEQHTKNARFESANSGIATHAIAYLFYACWHSTRCVHRCITLVDRIRLRNVRLSSTVAHSIHCRLIESVPAVIFVSVSYTYTLDVASCELDDDIAFSGCKQQLKRANRTLSKHSQQRDTQASETER